jgi:hypothetical protein
VSEPAAAGRATDPFLFALGHVRSGTTMLRAMLHSHPNLAVPPESYFVVPVLRIPQESFTADRLIERVRADRYFADWALPADALVELRTDPRVHTPADAVAGLYAAYARACGKTRYADKTPTHLLDVDLLAREFPRARFVHLVRDVRDVAASVVTMDFGQSSVGAAAWTWQRAVGRGHRAGVALGPDRYRLVHYEDLVADPEPVLREICELAGLPYDPAMLRYHERADELLAPIRDTGHLQGIRKPPTPRLRDWRVDLHPRDIRLVDEVAGDTLELVGYERSGLPIGAEDRLRAAALVARCEGRRRWRRTRNRLDSLYRRARP